MAAETIRRVDSVNPGAKKKIAFVDVEDALEQRARDVAEARMTEDKESLKGVKGLWKKFWKHNVAREFYRQKEIVKAKEEIRISGNIYAGEVADANAGRQAMDAIVDRFTVEYDEAIHEGETRRKVTERGTEGEALRQDVIKLVKDYVCGTINDTQFQEERARLFSQIHGIDRAQVDNQVRYADNLFETARQYKQAFEHGTRLDQLDFDFEVVIGKAKSGVRTEAQFNTFDRTVNKILQSKYGSFIPETAVVAAAGITSVISAGIERVGRSKLFAWASFGGTAALGAGMSYYREKTRLENERRQHFREMAQGKTFDPDKAKRRAQMEEFRYETQKARDLLDKLESAIYIRRPDGQLEVKDLSQDEFNGAMAALVDIESRIKISDRDHIDLISYSHLANVEKERMELDEARGRAKVMLRKLANKELRNGGGSTGPERIMGASIAIPGGVAFDRHLLSAISAREHSLITGDTGIEKKKSLFEKMQKRESWKKAGIGFATGLAFGAVAQEIGAAFRDNQEGLFEGIFSDKAHAETHSLTVLDSAWRWIKDGLPIEHHPLNNFTTDTGELIKIPDDTRFVSDGSGGYDFYRGTEPIAEHIHLNPNGSLTEESRKLLEENGVIVTENPVGHTLVDGISDDGSHRVRLPVGMKLVREGAIGGPYSLVRADGSVYARGIQFKPDGTLTDTTIADLNAKGVTITTITESGGAAVGGGAAAGGGRAGAFDAHDFIDKNRGLFREVKRNLWYDNDTPKPVFDKNELKLDWGGSGGIDPKTGNYVFDIKRMMPDGSYHNDFSVDAQDLMKNGELKIQISVSRGTQNLVYDVPIDTTGKAVIDKTSEIGKALFADVGGKAKFIGQFAEVVHVVDHTASGVEKVRILATAVGEGLGEAGGGGENMPVPTQVPRTIMDYDEVVPALDAPYEYFVEPPPNVPLYMRTPLERAKNPPRVERPPFAITPYNVYYPYSSAFAPVDRERVFADMSPRLRENPNVVLNPEQEISWYFQDQERRFPGYVNSLEGLRTQEQEKMGEEVEAVVALAVAGHQEHDNIYRTLMTYAVQKKKDGSSAWSGKTSKYEILIYVNWPQGANADRTFEKIEQFKREHPEVSVEVYKEEIVGKPELGWIKKKVFDLALHRHHERKNGKDILVIANDADMTYSSPYYLEGLRETANSEEGKKYDAFLGRYDLDPEVYDKNPTFHAIMRFWQFMESVLRNKFQNMYTQGRNTVLRGSSYAAIGGNRTKEFWADIEFGNFINLARGKNSIGYVNKAWLTVDPRREIDKFKNGEKVARTWGDFDTRGVRGVKKSTNDLPENIDVNHLATVGEDDVIVKQFRARLQEEIEDLINVFGYGLQIDADGKFIKDAQTPEVLRRASDFLGISCRIDWNAEGKAHIEITDTKKLRERLKEYHDKLRMATKIKTHPLYTPPRS